MWVSPERARWVREVRRVTAELRSGALIVELPFAGTDWLVREVLKEAGDAAVIEPEDARAAVLSAARRLAGRTPGGRQRSGGDNGARKPARDTRPRTGKARAAA
jgi:hypothetical protein